MSTAATRVFPLAFLFSAPAVEPRLRQAFSAAAIDVTLLAFGALVRNPFLASAASNIR